MKRKFKKILLSLACSLICTSVIGLSAVNISPELTITTDKDEYSAGEEIIVDVSLKNGTDNDIKEISINSEIPEGLKSKDGNIDYSTDFLSKGDSLSYNFTLVESYDTEVVNPGEGQDDQTDEENTTNGNDTSNLENDKIQNNSANNSSDKINNVNNTDKTKSINTGDKDYSYMILMFILSFIIIMGLTNKKIRKRFFIVMLIGGLISSSFVNVSALEETTINNISSSKIINVNNVEYVIDVVCTYSIEAFEEFIPSEDASDYYDENLYGDLGNIDHVDFNLETGERYFDNELLIFLNDKISNQSINILLDMTDGAYIVGKNEYDKSLQIRFDTSFDYKELIELLNKYNDSSLVDEAYLNYALTLESDDYIPNDTEWLDEWGNIGGLNWGVEAINAPAVWEYKDSMQSVNINVLDTGFNYDHEDLQEVIINLDNEKADHGTHVAGIIGAEFDNQKGISGIVPDGKLTTLSFRRKSIGTIIENEGLKLIETNSMVYKNSFTKLIVDSSENVAIINVSLWSGEYEKVFGASRGNIVAQKSVKLDSKLLETSLKELIKSGYDFIICSSAGNRNNVESFIERDDAPYGYYLVENIETDMDNYYVYYDIYGNEHKVNVILNENIVRGTVDTKYNSIVNYIEDEELKKRIIVVGAAGLNDDGYYKASFSNIGDRVDVYAPGVDIYSLWYDDNDSYNNAKYLSNDGTSMATPHVTGTIGLIYSFNKNLTGPELKELIINTANINVSNSDEKKMINALEAYNEMIENYLSQNIFAGGDGSKENPYQVSTPEQLNAVRNDLDAHYIQTSDIDLSIYENWEPIGGYGISNYNENNIFNGTYDGNNFKILNLKIKDNGKLATIGLFGCSNGHIDNLMIENVDIVVDTSHINFSELESVNMINIGSVVGVNGGNISNILSKGNIEVNGTIDMNTGGIVGTGGTITDSINYINFNIYTQPNDINGIYSSTIGFNCGGISGYSEEIDKCVNYGTIKASTKTYLNCGGINGEDSKITSCVNYGSISGKVTENIIYGSMGNDGNCNVGGIVGTTSYSVTDSVNYGNIYSFAGGYGLSFAAGIAGAFGYFSSGFIQNCYNMCDTIESYTHEGTTTSGFTPIYDDGYRLCNWSKKECTNLYSIDSTLVNGSIPTEFTSETELNGKSLTETEINEKIQYILNELGI